MPGVFAIACIKNTKSSPVSRLRVLFKFSFRILVLFLRLMPDRRDCPIGKIFCDLGHRTPDKNWSLDFTGYNLKAGLVNVSCTKLLLVFISTRNIFLIILFRKKEVLKYLIIVLK